MTAASHESIGESLCMNLRTLRKDGTPVDTPIWVVPIDGRICSYTDGRSFKAKRARNNPRVEVAACDVWGKNRGPWYPAVCRFVEDEAQRARVYALIAKKYGGHYTRSTLGSRLTGRIKHRVVLEIEVRPEDPLYIPR